MSVTNVANNPIGSYPVLVDKNSTNAQMQVVRLDFGTGAAESRVSATNPLPVSATFSGTGGGPIQDGVSATIEATVLDYTSSNPLAVRLTDTNGDYIAAGAGTQYTEGDTAAAAIGTVFLWKDAGNAITSVTAAKPLPTADAAAEASLSVIDDWDETDRCKVNPIAGQAGVAGNTGVVTALTQRVCLATDVPLPAGTNALGKLTANSGVIIGDVNLVSSIPAGTNGIGKLTANGGVVIGDVNIISGQTGVAAGSGVVGATTQRVVLATDVALPAGTNAIGKLSSNSGVVIGDVNVVTQATGLTLLSATGSAASNGNNTLIAADATLKIKVFAFSLMTVSTTAVLCKFQSGASGTDLWSVYLQAPSSVSVGANLSVAPPSFLFSTAAVTLLNLNLSSAQTVYWSVSYFIQA